MEKPEEIDLTPEVNKIDNISRSNNIIHIILVFFSYMAIFCSIILISASSFIMLKTTKYNKSKLDSIITDSNYAEFSKPNGKNNYLYSTQPIQFFINDLRYSNTKNVEKMLSLGINPNGYFTRSYQGNQTALWVALNSNSNWPVIKILLEHNAKWLVNSTKEQDVQIIRAYSKIIPNFDTKSMNEYFESIGYKEKTTIAPTKTVVNNVVKKPTKVVKSNNKAKSTPVKQKQPSTVKKNNAPKPKS